MMRVRSKAAAVGGARTAKVTTAARRPALSARAFRDERFDYIIVGGGTAGCVLANRLTADQSKKVLVLEAGEDNKDFVVKAPAGLVKLFFHDLLNWNLDSTSQKPIGGRDIYLSRGKVLGGSSSVNATLYHRGSAQDYDNWKLPGWSSKDVLPWFVMIEDNPSMAANKDYQNYHNVGGGMHVERPIYQNELFDKFFQASEQFGQKRNPDFNAWSHTQDGYGEFQVYTTARGRRTDAYRQFLDPVKGRSNLTVLTRAHTHKVHIEKVNGKPTAVGVEFQRWDGGHPFGPTESVMLAEGGEVIMAAGAVHTPQLLMLSGVGDAKHLREHGIECHADLPSVGQGLQDHPGVLTAFEINQSSSIKTLTDEIYNSSGDISKRSVFNWLVFGKGPLTSAGCDRGAFLRTHPSKKQPDVQLRFVAAQALNADAIKSYVEFGRLKQLGRTTWPKGITFQILGVRPESRGSVRLASSKITEAPLVDVAYCADAAGADRASLREGIRITRKIAAQSALADVLESEVHPGVDVSDDKQLDEYIDRTIHSGNALTSSCVMGTSPANSVVSSEDLTVHGVAALRVVDASVLPVIPGGQTGAPVYMVAERAAAMLLQGSKAVASAELKLPALV